MKLTYGILLPIVSIVVQNNNLYGQHQAEKNKGFVQHLAAHGHARKAYEYTFLQALHSIHFVSLIIGYLNPSSFSSIYIQSLGQTFLHAVHPVHSSLFSHIVFSIIFYHFLIAMLFPETQNFVFLMLIIYNPLSYNQ